MAQIVLELRASLICFRLSGAQAGHTSSSRSCTRFSVFQLLARVVEVAPPVLQRAVALRRAHASGSSSEASLCAQPLLQPAPARSGGRAAPPRGRRGRAAGRGFRGRRRRGLRWGVATPLQPDPALDGPHGRCTSIHHRNRDTRRDQRRQHDLHLRLLTRRTERRLNTRFVERCGAWPRDSRHRLGAGTRPQGARCSGQGPSRTLLSGWSRSVVRIKFR